MKAVNIDDGFCHMLCGSVRYAIGRETYIPKMTVDYITKLLPDIPTRYLQIMQRDLEEEADYLGSEHFARLWEKFHRDVCIEISKRGDACGELQDWKY